MTSRIMTTTEASRLLPVLLVITLVYLTSLRRMLTICSAVRCELTHVKGGRYLLREKLHLEAFAINTKHEKYVDKKEPGEQLVGPTRSL